MSRMLKSFVAVATVEVVLAGQCSTNDHEFWSSYDQTFSDFLTGCAKKEWGSAEKTAKCLTSDPRSDLSAPCATCFGEYENCAKSECWFHCMWDSTSNWCLDCIEGSRCRSELETCTGYGSAQLPPRPLGTLSKLPVLGQCSDQDHDFWSSYGQEFSDFLTGCAKKEWGSAEKTTQCLLGDPMNKLSYPCASCFGDFQNCAKDECWYTCMWSSTSSSCLRCIDKSKCPGELATCSGYTEEELPPKPNTPVTSLPTTTMAPTTSTTSTSTMTTTESTTASVMTTSSTSTITSTYTTTIATGATTTAVVTPVVEGKCTVADYSLWSSYGQAYSNFIAYCGKQAWGDANGTTECLEKSGLTPTCSACFGQSVGCGRDKCMFSCLSGPTTTKCLDCIAKTECNPDLYKCTGYPASEMPPVPTAVSPLPVTTSSVTTVPATTTKLAIVNSTTTTTIRSTTFPSTITSKATTEATSFTTTTPVMTTPSTKATTPVMTTSSTMTTTPVMTTSSTKATTPVMTTSPTMTTTPVMTTSPTKATTPVMTTSSSTITVVTTTTPVVKGDCTAADHSLWKNYGQAYSNFIAYCGKQAWGSADGTTKCLEQSGLTSSCSTCFGQSVQCGRDKCMFKCLSGPTTDKCLECIAKTECDPDLYKCTGYSAAEMPPVPTAVEPLPKASGVSDATTTIPSLLI